MKLSHSLLALSCMVATVPTAWAGAGHDHGDAPPAAAEQALPRVTATTETFELVGRLHADELSILIDRSATNEPVLGAELTVEFNGRSVVAPFHADHGDYSLSDSQILAQLRQPGSKALVFTLIAGEDSDLLTGELDVHDAHETAALPSRPAWHVYSFGGAAGLLAAFAVVHRRTARNPRSGGAA
ncbi:MAG TPA: hypothetical protein VF096_16110 [Azonexus sp.]